MTLILKNTCKCGACIKETYKEFNKEVWLFRECLDCGYAEEWPIIY